LAVVPGEAATPEVLRHQTNREALIALVHRFAAYGLSWAAGDPAKITPETEEVAEAFLRELPSCKALPKISPDGEGGLTLVWEHAGETFIMTIEDSRLHGVIAAATSHAQYIDDLPWKSLQDIPERILNAIPHR